MLDYRNLNCATETLRAALDEVKEAHEEADALKAEVGRSLASGDVSESAVTRLACQTAKLQLLPGRLGILERSAEEAAKGASSALLDLGQRALADSHSESDRCAAEVRQFVASLGCDSEVIRQAIDLIVPRSAGVKSLRLRAHRLEIARGAREPASLLVNALAVLEEVGAAKKDKP